MPTFQKVQEKEFGTTLPITQFIGLNTYGQHSALKPGEFRTLENFEVYLTYLKNRRGCQFNRPVSGYQRYTGDYDVYRGVSWDIGAEEYLITQNGTTFYSKALLTPANPVLINDVNGNAFAVGSTDQADMFIEGDKLYIFHPEGNKIIQWNSTSSVFEGRAMGIDYPAINALPAADGAGNATGEYIYGVEFVYQVDGIDISNSSPNRFTASRIFARTDTLSSNKVKIPISAATLDVTDVSSELWTHVRLWRTKNLLIDVTNTANPVEPQGQEDILYEVALITKAELLDDTPGNIATGVTLPAGNVNTEAGIDTGLATIWDDSTDDYLTRIVDIDRIELTPMPEASLGTFVGNRIFVSAVNTTSLNDNEVISDDSKNNIFYSNYAGTPYSELTKGTNVINTGKDGQEMKKLVAFEKDLVALKDGKTLRLPDGDVDLEIETTDPKIGISHPNLATFVPTLGICAVTTDHGDFRILGYDLTWRNTFNNLEISKPLREQTQDLTAANVSIIYVNGKLMIGDGTGTFYCLNVEAGRGWSKYEYEFDSTAQLAVTFANGARALVVSSGHYPVEIEVEDLETDVNLETETAGNNINCEWDTHDFQSGEGEHVLEHDWLSIMAALTNDGNQNIVAAPYANGLPWPSGTTAKYTQFQGVGLEGSYTALKDREYRLYLEPETIGTFEWCRLIANYIYFNIKTSAPCIIKAHGLRCKIDTDGISSGGFDPWQQNEETQEPSWLVSTITETGDSTDDTVTETGSSSDDTFTEGM